MKFKSGMPEGHDRWRKEPQILLVDDSKETGMG